MKDVSSAMSDLVRLLSDKASMLEEIGCITSERDDYLRQLQLFWRAEKRPWFCPNCQVENNQKHMGYLQPFGRDGLRCAHCETVYRPVQK